MPGQHRPGYVRPRNQTVSFRCSPEEFELIEKLAKESGLRISTYARLRAMKVSITDKHKNDKRSSARE